jgi:hypothetical protein
MSHRRLTAELRDFIRDNMPLEAAVVTAARMCENLDMPDETRRLSRALLGAVFSAFLSDPLDESIVDGDGNTGEIVTGKARVGTGGTSGNAGGGLCDGDADGVLGVHGSAPVVSGLAKSAPAVRTRRGRRLSTKRVLAAKARK